MEKHSITARLKEINSYYDRLDEKIDNLDTDEVSKYRKRRANKDERRYFLALGMDLNVAIRLPVHFFEEDEKEL